MNTNVLTAAEFNDFWANLEKVTRLVRAFLTDSEPHDLQALSTEVKEQTDRKILVNTMSFAQKLLDKAAEASIQTVDDDRRPRPDWLNAYRDSAAYQGIGPSGADFLDRRVEEILMEHLTATWLVLYFLGAPMGHPWARVRRIADEEGGYPSGACTTKMIGDVYRQSRLEHQVAALASGPSTDEDNDEFRGVLVLSTHPSVLIKGLLSRVDKDKLTPVALHQLGRCYAFFQLRLYAAKGLPIRYLVSMETLQRRWGEQNEAHDVFSEEAARRIATWLTTVFPPKGASDQSVALYPGLDSFGLPSCALGRRVGVYALETGKDEVLRFTGNWVNNRLLDSFRHRLTKPPGLEIELLGLSPAQLQQSLNQVRAPPA